MNFMMKYNTTNPLSPLNNRQKDRQSNENTKSKKQKTNKQRRKQELKQAINILQYSALTIYETTYSFFFFFNIYLIRKKKP